MANASAMRRAAELSGADVIGPIAVSAGGRVANEKKVTDELIAAHSSFCRGEGERKIFSGLCSRLSALAEELRINFNVTDELMKIGYEESKSSSPDFLISRGEYLYSKIFAKLTARPFVDCAEIIRFNDSGRSDYEFSRYLIREKYRELGGFVTGGFYGSDPRGKIRLFPRGGGDITGSLLALGTNADEYLNFTDVDGVLSFPPSFAARFAVKNEKIDNNDFVAPVVPRPLKRISFSRMERLCDFSVNVFHADALNALKGSGIPVRIKNTFNKYAEGTAITEKSEKRDEFFFASDKFGAIKNTLESKREEVGLYAEFLSQTKNAADDEDEIFYFSDCDKSAELTEKLQIKAKCPVFKAKEGYIAVVKKGGFLPEVKKIFYRFIIQPSQSGGIL